MTVAAYGLTTVAGLISRLGTKEKRHGFARIFRDQTFEKHKNDL